jgi:hypothetical protein
METPPTLFRSVTQLSHLTTYIDTALSNGDLQSIQRAVDAAHQVGKVSHSLEVSLRSHLADKRFFEG